MEKSKTKAKLIDQSQKASVDFSRGDQSLASLKQNNLIKYDELEEYKTLRKKRTKRAWIRACIWLLVLLMTPLIVFFSLVIINPNSGVNFFGYTFYIVESESMRPVFDINDCIVVKNVNSREEIQIGTDICFIRKSDGRIVTHRVIGSVINEHGEEEYITRGVHNTVADEGSVAFENIIGRRVGVLTALGHIVMFFRTWVGILIFLGLFITLMFGFVISFRYSNDIRSVGN